MVAGRSSHHHIRDEVCADFISADSLYVSGVKRPSSGVLKTGTAASGTCVMVVGRSSHHHIE